MKLAFTIHEIIGKGGVNAPGSVMELDAASYAELEGLGAIRAANEAEIALYRLASGAAKPASAPEPVADARAEVDARAELEARAKELGVKFQRNTSDEVLAARIAEADAELKLPSDPDEVDGL